jgi:FixJ family two-component response regulator
MKHHDCDIFVIDDDESVRRALKRLLGSLGYAVKVFDSATAFLDSGKCSEACCLILDVRMPGMGGLELQERLLHEGRKVSIIFVTAHDDETTQYRAMSNGAIAFLHKPFEEQLLISAVGTALQRAGH